MAVISVFLVASTLAGGCSSPADPIAASAGAARARFRDQAHDLGLTYRGRSYAAATADFDRDGWLDLALSAHGAIRLYRNERGRFGDVSRSFGLVDDDTHGLGWTDLDGDGWLDLFVSVGANRGFGRGDNQIYRNVRGETLTPATDSPEVLLDPFGRGRCACMVDLDGDEGLDIIVANAYQEGRPTRLARFSTRGHYAEASGETGVRDIQSECFTAIRPTASGPPVLVAYGGGSHSGRAFSPGPDGRLRDVTDEVGLPPAQGPAYSAISGDYDGDGDPDLYFVHGHEVPPGVAVADRTLAFRLVARGAGEVPQLQFRCRRPLEADLLVGFNRAAGRVFLGAERRHPESVPWSIRPDDAALVGAPDLGPSAEPGLYLWRTAPDHYAVAAVGDGRRVRGVSGSFRSPCRFELLGDSAELQRPPQPRPNRLFENRGGRFSEVTEAAGVGDALSGRDAVFFDLENDGDLDLFVVNGGLAFENQDDVLYRNDGDGTFTDITSAAGVAGSREGRGATVTALDFDRDGDVDLFVTNGDGPPLGNEAPVMLWRNDTEPQGNWLEVDLAGRDGNPSAMGARVTARFRDGVLGQQRVSTNGRFSTSVAPLHFGIGKAAEAEVEVEWPSGERTITVVSAGERRLLREPRDPSER